MATAAQRMMEVEKAVAGTAVERRMVPEEAAMMERMAAITRWIQTQIQPLRGTMSTGTILCGQLSSTCRRLGFASGLSGFAAMGR